MSKPADHEAQIAAYVKMWDAGEIITFPQLGGIGPGYDQAICILIIELARRKVWKLPLNVVLNLDELAWIRMSGAQMGVALQFLAVAKTIGWDKATKAYEQQILADRDFPRYPENQA